MAEIYTGYKTKTIANKTIFWTTGIYQNPTHFRGLPELHGPKLRGSQWRRPYSCENIRKVTASIELSRWPSECVERLTGGYSDASSTGYGIRAGQSANLTMYLLPVEVYKWAMRRCRSLAGCWGTLCHASTSLAIRSKSGHLWECRKDFYGFFSQRFRFRALHPVRVHYHRLVLTRRYYSERFATYYKYALDSFGFLLNLLPTLLSFPNSSQKHTQAYHAFYSLRYGIACLSGDRQWPAFIQATAISAVNSRE